MHETLHTYHFLAFGEKTPSLLFMLRKEKYPCFAKRDPFFCDKADEAVFPEAYFVP
jgi:hypothetical protein